MEKTDQETQQELVTRLLSEVSEMQKENKQLQSGVPTLKA